MAAEIWLAKDIRNALQAAHLAMAATMDETRRWGLTGPGAP